MIVSTMFCALCAALSLIDFFLCGWDKLAVKRGGRRVPERRLLSLALLGGGPGLWLGMTLFRHKTRHWYFRVAAALTTVLWCLLLVWLRQTAQGSR